MTPKHAPTVNAQAPAREADRGRRHNPAEVPLAAARAACERVAPLWPLHRFVAVNPFLGLSDRPFENAAGLLSQVSGARVLMPRLYYVNALAAGRITRTDLEEALKRVPRKAGQPESVDALLLELQADPIGVPPTPLRTVADLAAECTGRDWNRLAVEHICRWAAAYFDKRQARIRSGKGQPSAYAAFRAEARLDPTPRLWGLVGARAQFTQLPDTAEGMLDEAQRRLGVPRVGLSDYYHRLLMDFPGWVGRARHVAWEAGLRGQKDDGAIELLAVRLAWECVLHACIDVDALKPRWQTLRDAYAFSGNHPVTQRAVQIDAVLQAALEHRAQVRTAQALAGQTPAPSPALCAAHVVHCIDVRSEPLRRALEATTHGISTSGFAGFFGFPVAFEPLGAEEGQPRCPALLAPPLHVRESITPDADRAKVGKTAAQTGWKRFGTSAAGSFGLVEALGLAYAKNLIAETLRGSMSPRRRAKEQQAAKLAAGIPLDTQLDLAESALRGMSLPQPLPRVVVFLGHGSTSQNNPHASGLDCGACGGHAGDVNARLATEVLNSSAVRQGLLERGVQLPDSTIFVAGQHETTTGQVTLFDPEGVPQSHREECRRLQQALDEAAAVAVAERERKVPVPLSTHVPGRAIDWSQTRPEWGLAGCHAFIAARREVTRGVDLDGRVFLQEYDYARDGDEKVLETVMTAPMVVASWIALQYYASTVDNDRFGAGNKVLHNVVGGEAVLEGAGGDLRVGLALQSVHDGTRLIHEPLRLTAMIQAPPDAIERVLRRHPNVRQLLDHGWMHLLTLDEAGHVDQRYQRGEGFQPFSTAEA